MRVLILKTPKRLLVAVAVKVLLYDNNLAARIGL
jgi:hypothetical protein